MSEPSLTDTKNDMDGIEEEIEPKLKYSRLLNDVPTTLKHNPATCMAAHPKFICLGTREGKIHLFDHQGNLINGAIFEDKHLFAVNQISIDLKGDFLATCSDDGKVCVHALFSKENSLQIKVDRFVKTVALDPNYFKQSIGKRFITGDLKLTLHEKTFLGKLRSTVLCGSEGYVQSLCWGENYVALSSDIGVRVYDINARCSLGLIQWEEHPGIPINKFRCNLRWADNRTLLIGWVDIVRVCVIRKRSTNEVANRDLPSYLVDPVATFKTEFYICGIAPLDHQLVLLGFSKELDKNNKSLRPQLYIVDYSDDDYTDFCTDSLSLRGFENYGVNDYHLDVLTEENRFFIMAPEDCVVASPYDLDDRIQWLIKHGKFEDALETAQSDSRKKRRFTREMVGIAYLDNLLAKKEYDIAGKLCYRVFGKNKKLWEEEIFKFATVRQLRSVSPYLPRTLETKLDKHIYEMVLYEYLKMDSKGFLKLINEWDYQLYNTSAVTNAVLEHLMVCAENNDVYLEALALLYSYEKKYDKSLATYLSLKNKNIFNLIKKHKLYNVIENVIVDLMNLDHEKAIDLFLEKDNAIPAHTVVSKLSGHDRLLYQYLDRYYKYDTKGQYHRHLVSLYAVFNKEKLLPLLQRSFYYPIQEALDICNKHQYYWEMVYLLDKIGDTKEALQLIMEKLKDISHAISFCQKQNDPDLWNDLINHSLNNQEYVAYLLEGLGTYMDPTVLIQKIKKDMQIPGLKGSLVKMLGTYNLQVSVQESCKKIVVSDYFNLHEKVVKIQQRGILVSNEMVCGRCGKVVLINQSNSRNIIIFNCKHAFHEQCLPNTEDVTYCSICHETTNNYHISGN